MIFNSIRWRLQAWHGLILVAVLTGFGLTAYHVADESQLRRIDQELDQRLMALLRPPPPELRKGRPPEPPPDEPRQNRRFDGPEFLSRIRASVEQAPNLDAGQTNELYYVLWQGDDSVVARSPGAPADVPLPTHPSPPSRQSAKSDASPAQSASNPPGPPMAPGSRTRGEVREAFIFLPHGECLLAGQSLAPERAAMRRLALWLFIAGASVLVLGLAGGWWLATRTIRPIEDISATAVRISAGDLSQRINAADTDSELGHLVRVLNSTFARLEDAFAQQRQFTADASHELRTPLAVLITEAQTILARERPPAEYRETIEGCLATAQQMRRLVESLLELARFDANQQTMKREAFDLSQVARARVDLVRPLADRRGIKIDCDFKAVTCLGDPDRFSQVVTNLLTNAIDYNRDQGHIRVSVEIEGANVLLKVEDTGEGIPAADLPHIFERFYRADKARSRVQGRAGLGLAICKAIVTAHRGTIDASSQSGRGTTLAVRLPLP